jgi:ELWxxDGT repeat protein
LYFIASGGVWTTDGTEAGTTLVEAGFHSLLDELEGDLFMARRIPYPLEGTQIWRRDLSLLAATEIERNGIGTANSDPSAPVNLDGVLYFAANDGVVGSELFKLDQGVVTLVKDINLGSGNSWIDNLTSINGALYFSASSPTMGNGLWRSDGTPTGTEFLAAVHPAGDVGKPVFTQVGDEMFFRGYDSTGWELWKTDGTASGTMRVLDINPGSTYEYGIGFIINSSHPSGFTNLNGTLYFSAADRVSGRELWKSDGTAAGTTLAVDLFPGRDPYYPYYLNSANVNNITGFKGALYFVGQNEVEGFGIWKSDGTLSGTEFVKRYNSIGTSTQNLLVVDDHIYFAGNAQGRDEELWRTDGTTAGTLLVKDIRLGARSSDIQQLTRANGRVYFTADDGTHGRELWVSDGTAAGTHMVRDIRTGIDSLNRPMSSNPNNLTNLNGTLYFTADDGVRGRELYKTHGTMGGASLVRDLVPGITTSDPKNLAAHNGAVYFSAKTNVGRELWQARAAAPLLRVSNSILSYVEDASPLSLAASATLYDVDSPVLFGGEVRVAFTTPARVGDELSIGNIGDVSTVQNQVLYMGIVVGRFAGGVAGVPLSISLNQNASVAATQAIIRAITFAATSQNPYAGRRVIRFDVFDGDGAASLARYVRVDVTAVNDTPMLTDASGDVNYQLNAALGVRIAREAIVSDVDSSNFEGGKLRIVVTGGDRSRNRLELLGTLFTIDASNNLLRNGVIIGTAIANAGVGFVPFEVTFHRNATPSIVQQLLRSIAFKTVGSTQTVNRSISISLTDGDGGPSASLQKSVIIT